MQALIDFDGWRKWKDFSQSKENTPSKNPKQLPPNSPNPLKPTTPNPRKASSNPNSAKSDKTSAEKGKLTLPERTTKKRLSSSSASVDTATLNGSGSEGVVGDEREGRRGGPVGVAA